MDRNGSAWLPFRAAHKVRVAIAAANSQFRSAFEDIGANYPIDGQRGVPASLPGRLTLMGGRQTVAAPFYAAAAPQSSPTRRVCVAGAGVF